MKIARILNLVALFAMLVSALVVYRIKYQATYQAEEVERLERQIAREREDINALGALWAQLDRPDRIQMLAEKHLGLTYADPRQNVRADQLPARAPKVDQIADIMASLGGEDKPLAAEPDDPIARTIKAMGLAVPTKEDRADRTLKALGIGTSGTEQ